MTTGRRPQRQPTFFGSDTAPDGVTEQLRLREIRQKSREPVSCHAVFGLAILATSFTQRLLRRSDRQPVQRQTRQTEQRETFLADSTDRFRGMRQSVARTVESESGRMNMACDVVQRTYAGTSLRVKSITAKPIATIA